MPRPGPQHEQLARLAGTWEGTEKMYPSPWAPEGSNAAGGIVSEMQIDGFFLVSNYEQRHGDHVTFRGHGVYGFDAPSGKYTMHWFDSMGMDPGGPATGVFDGDTLEFRNESPMGLHRYVYTMKSADEYTFSMGMSRDGGETWQPLMEGIYVRA